MHERARTRPGVTSEKVAAVIFFLLISVPAAALAQTPPAAEATPSAVPATNEAPPRAPEPPPQQLSSAPAAPPAPPAPATIPLGTAPRGPVPPAWPPAMPNIDYGGRLRAGLRFQSATNPAALGDVAQSIYADIYAGGQITPMWRWLLALTTNDYGAGTGATSATTMSLLDGFIGFTPRPEFQVYIGRMLVMADRFAPGGPWGLDEWFYPGFFPGTPPAVPKAGPSGRDYGVAAWGAPLEGHLKYYLGAYQLQDPTLSPLYSGRLQVSLLSAEPGWFQRTTYYGDRDLVSFGVGGQFQHGGSVMTVPPAMTGMMAPAPLLDDYKEVNADVVVEKRLGDLGALSFEGAYYNFQGIYQPWKWSALGAIAYNSPVLAGIGKLRPSFRFQQAQARQVTSSGQSLDPTRVYDVQLTYNVMAWFAHVVLSYRHADVVYASLSGAAPGASPAPVKNNMIVLGLQLWDP